MTTHNAALRRCCRSCRQSKLITEFSYYCNGRVKQVCEACVERAARKRIRKPVIVQRDEREYKHPLETVFATWVRP